MVKPYAIASLLAAARRLALGLFATVVLAASGANATPNPPLAPAKKTPGKLGVYCRFDDVINQPEALQKTMAAIKAAGIDFILPYAKLTSGKVNWASSRATPDLGTHPDFLARVVESAHAAGLQVYPVFCVTTEGGEERGNTVLTQHPDWAYFFDGARRGYIDPGNPAARRYEVDLIVEMVTKYPVDGLSLDYLRAPNRAGYTDTGRAAFLTRHGVDLAQIVAGTDAGALDTEGGGKPTRPTVDAVHHPLWGEWRAWRREQLNQFMREIRTAVAQARPGLPISTYCWGAQTYTGNYETCQDWKTWIAEGWLDWINPSAYRYDDDDFRQAAALNRANVPKGFPFYLTIGVKTSHGELTDLAAVRRHMAMAKDAGAEGLVFFTWESLRRFLPEVSADLHAW